MAGLGLVDYGSSDEEDLENLEVEEQPSGAVEDSLSIEAKDDTTTETQTNGSHHSTSQPLQTADLPDNAQPEGPLVGPQLGPAGSIDLPEPEDLDEDEDAVAGASADVVPQSPYSANRALLRDLTLPTVPNYDIPPSPPGSPVASTNAKFKHFLELKKQGVHFNEKLAKSAALKNPSLMQKLMDFADISEIEQYATTLPEDLWNPGSFPEYAYKEELAKSQKKIQADKARGQKEPVDFVPASTSDDISRSGTPSAGVSSGRGQQSAAERIMAGLDRGRSNSPHTQGVKRKTRFES